MATTMSELQGELKRERKRRPKQSLRKVGEIEASLVVVRNASARLRSVGASGAGSMAMYAELPLHKSQQMPGRYVRRGLQRSLGLTSSRVAPNVICGAGKNARTGEGACQQTFTCAHSRSCTMGGEQTRVHTLMVDGWREELEQRAGIDTLKEDPTPFFYKRANNETRLNSVVRQARQVEAATSSTSNPTKRQPFGGGRGGGQMRMDLVTKRVLVPPPPGDGGHSNKEANIMDQLLNKKLMLDVTIGEVQSPTHREAAALLAGRVNMEASKRKHNKYRPKQEYSDDTYTLLEELNLLLEVVDTLIHQV